MTLFVHPLFFNAATSNHSKNWASRIWIRIITKKSMQHGGGFGFIVQQVGLALPWQLVNKFCGDGENGG